MANEKRSLLEQKQDLYNSGKLKSVSVTWTKKCNLGNFENFDTTLTYNLEGVTLEEERTAFAVVVATVKAKENEIKDFLRNAK